jgi:hypothetical protein
LIALIFGAVLAAGLGGYTFTLLGTIARGKAIPQEILVDRDGPDE